jgi:hypothetical protein
MNIPNYYIENVSYVEGDKEAEFCFSEKIDVSSV